jgi:hypothetical protein
MTQRPSRINPLTSAALDPMRANLDCLSFIRGVSYVRKKEAVTSSLADQPSTSVVKIASSEIRAGKRNVVDVEVPAAELQLESKRDPESCTFCVHFDFAGFVVDCAAAVAV